MSLTDLAAAGGAIPEIVARKALRHTLVKGYFSRWAGAPGAGTPVVRMVDIENGPGDVLRVPITEPLSGAGVTQETTLVGAEEALSISSIVTRPVRYRHAVRVGDLAERQSAISLQEEARFRLSEWMAAKLDSVRFAAIVADALPAPDASETYDANVVYAGSGNAAADDLAATDVLTLDFIRKVRLTLVEQGAQPLIGPDGSERFGMIVHSRNAYQLKGDAALQQALREADVRGSGNPMWSGSLGVIDGVALFESSSVPTAANTGSVTYAKCFAFGAEAIVEAIGGGLKFVDESFDYQAEQGYSFQCSFHPRRGLEQNSLRVLVAAPAVS